MRSHPGSYPSPARIPRRLDTDDPTSTDPSPLPRHHVRRLPRTTPRSANHPVYLNHDLHLVNDDDLHHNFDDDRSRTRGAYVSPTDRTPSAVTRGLPTGDRESDRAALVPLRTRGRAVGDRDRLARVELPARRSESHWLLFGVPVGVAPAQGVLRGSWVSRLVRGTVRRQRICGSRRIAVCVLGAITLATLIGEVR